MPGVFRQRSILYSRPRRRWVGSLPPVLTSFAVRDVRATGQDTSSISRDVRATGTSTSIVLRDVRVTGAQTTSVSAIVRVTGGLASSRSVDVRLTGVGGAISQVIVDGQLMATSELTRLNSQMFLDDSGDMLIQITGNYYQKLA